MFKSILTPKFNSPRIRNPIMKNLLLVIAVTLGSFIATLDTVQAQFGSSQSQSWSTQSSSSWGRSQGFGPGGYFDNNYSNRQSSGSFSQSNNSFTPWGGSSSGTTQQWGNRQSTFNNSGFNNFGGGVWRNQGGSSDSFSSGRNWNNSWPW
jgi:hypothetical protein